MEMPSRHNFTLKTALGTVLLVIVLAFSIHVARKLLELQSFNEHALQVMSQLTAASRVAGPLGQFKSEFDTLAASEHGLGRMLAIAYTERMGTVHDRDMVIVAAANELTGKDLYRLLKATSPLFDPDARARYLKGEVVNVIVPGIDMTLSTLSAAQREAMLACLTAVTGHYDPDGLLGRLKVATSLYAGVSWETCRVPTAIKYDDKQTRIRDTI